jgi:myo-inositol-1-phosphate synthase
MAKVRIAIAGVGNCASSLVQGVYYYANARDDDFVPGLMHVRLGGYHVADVEVVAAFDVDADKVGKDLSKALFVPLNNTIKFCDVPTTGVTVQRGETHDGLGKYYRQTIRESEATPVDVAEVLRERQVDVLVNYLPVGSEKAVRWYMEQALEAGVGVVNCMPVFIAKDARWSQRFADRGLPIVGDDIKAQVGATIVHRVLTRLMNDRGVKVERMSQLNVGGNMDFMNMLESERLESKRISKTDAVVSQLDYKIEPENVHIGPSDYVPWLHDRKWCYLRIEGREFGDVPVNIELKLEVWDSPNSAGVGIDAIRCAKLALDRGVAGALIGPSAYFMKSPPIQYTDSEAREMVESFIQGR